MFVCFVAGFVRIMITFSSPAHILNLCGGLSYTIVLQGLHLLLGHFTKFATHKPLKLKISKRHCLLCYLCYCILHLERKKNSRFHQEIQRDRQNIIQEILQNLRSFATSWKGIKKKKRNWEIGINLGLLMKIFSPWVYSLLAAVCLSQMADISIHILILLLDTSPIFPKSQHHIQIYKS